MFGATAGSSAPIARIAAESAAESALRELVDDMNTARSQGRMVLKIPLSDIAPDHLARDRVSLDADEMQTLARSIHQHGQRTPIEVTEIEGPHKYGLISGWRRLTALEQLKEHTGDAKYDTVLALLRQPKDASDAYISMVEENEIRVGLSYYERARIAAEATRRGVFENEKKALQALFASASRAKRSRIRAFIALYHALDDVLKFPTAIPERLGLATLEKLRNDPSAADHIRSGLENSPPENAEQEMSLLASLLQAEKKPKSENVPHAEHLIEVLPNGLKLALKGNKIEITGKTVSPELLSHLKSVLGGQRR